MIEEERKAMWKERLAFCIKYTDRLSDWEIGFIDSIDSQFDKKGELTLKQSFKLGQIYHKLEEEIG